MTNAFSVDIEDYWSIFFRDWLDIKDSQPTEAIVKNTRRILELLENYQVKSTFFVLGEVVEKFPSIILEIDKHGHELASHGQSHRQIFKTYPEQFRNEAEHCKKYLEDLTGRQVFGFRAPAFSVNHRTKWALDILAEVGFEYDSSVYPFAGRRYGWPDFSKKICEIKLPSGNTIFEVPMSTVRILGKDLPACGGGYLRHFPYAFTKWAIEHVQKKRPAIVYMHPYEFDTDRVDFKTGHLAGERKNVALRFHRYQMRNRKTVRVKIERLLKDFEFTTIRNLIENSKCEISDR
jgi:polysaccharide deacetylase family protein (PEP-CTERM system associated)